MPSSFDKGGPDPCGCTAGIVGAQCHGPATDVQHAFAGLYVRCAGRHSIKEMVHGPKTGRCGGYLQVVVSMQPFVGGTGYIPAAPHHFVAVAINVQRGHLAAGTRWGFHLVAANVYIMCYFNRPHRIF
jgi:hypothetical protein